MSTHLQMYVNGTVHRTVLSFTVCQVMSDTPFCSCLLSFCQCLLNFKCFILLHVGSSCSLQSSWGMITRAHPSSLLFLLFFCLFSCCGRLPPSPPSSNSPTLFFSLADTVTLSSCYGMYCSQSLRFMHMAHFYSIYFLPLLHIPALIPCDHISTARAPGPCLFHQNAC